MDIWTIALLLVILGLAIYYFLFRDVYHFAEYNIPYTKPYPIIGNLADIILQRRSLVELMESIYKMEPREAKYVGFFVGTKPFLVIRDVELIKYLTVKNFDYFMNHEDLFNNSDDLFHKTLFFLHGDKWKRMRTILSPAFTSSKLKTMFKLMYDCGIDFTNAVLESSQHKVDLDMQQLFIKYTTDMIATCGFGITVNSMKNPDNEFYTSGTELVRSFRSATRFMLLRFFPKLSQLLSIRVTPEHIMKFFKDIISSTVKLRDEKHINRPDMLQLIMDMRGKQNDLNMDDIIAQAFLFFVAGFNTISFTACFTCHELAVNPDIQTRLQNEIDEVLEKCNGVPTYDAINSMEYLNAVISESLRFYPVVPVIDRVCVKDIELEPSLPDSKPFVVKKGMVIWIPAAAIHRDPQFYEDPNRFNPDRFIERKEDRNSATFLPFGIGPRMCIGNRFAEMELKVLLFNLLARSNLVVGEKTQVPLQWAKTFALEPEKGFWLQIEGRKNVHPTIQKNVSNGNIPS